VFQRLCLASECVWATNEPSYPFENSIQHAHTRAHTHKSVGLERKEKGAPAAVSQTGEVCVWGGGGVRVCVRVSVCGCMFACKNSGQIPQRSFAAKNLISNLQISTSQENHRSMQQMPPVVSQAGLNREHLVCQHCHTRVAKPKFYLLQKHHT